MAGRVIVIGGGAAGALSALAARRKGAEVTLVRRALGATSVSSGAFDFAAGVDQEGRRLAMPRAAQVIAREHPRHPYACLGSSLADALSRARALLVEELAALGVRGADNDSRNLELVTPLGAMKEAALAQGSIARGDLASWPSDARIGVVGIVGHAATDPSLVTNGLRAGGRDAVEVYVKLELDPQSALADLARLLDGPTKDAVLTRIALAAKEVGATHVLLPTAGFDHPDAVCDALCAMNFSAAAELMNTPPSIAGLRLDRALNDRLMEAGVTVVIGDVKSTSANAGRIDKLLLDDRELSADAFVLATGRFLGGGIVHQERFREPVFGLPVFVDGRDVGDMWTGDLLDKHAANDQPAMRAGVQVDARMRPVDDGQRAVYDNLFAAGAVIGGYEAARDATGLGVAAVTALVAGEAAATKTSLSRATTGSSER